MGPCPGLAGILITRGKGPDEERRVSSAKRIPSESGRHSPLARDGESSSEPDRAGHPSQGSVATGWRLTNRGRRAAPCPSRDELAARTATEERQVSSATIRSDRYPQRLY